MVSVYNINLCSCLNNNFNILKTLLQTIWHFSYRKMKSWPPPWEFNVSTQGMYFFNSQKYMGKKCSLCWSTKVPTGWLTLRWRLWVTCKEDPETAMLEKPHLSILFDGHTWALTFQQPANTPDMRRKLVQTFQTCLSASWIKYELVNLSRLHRMKESPPEPCEILLPQNNEIQ